MIKANVSIDKADLAADAGRKGRGKGEQFTLSDEQSEKLDSAIMTLIIVEGVKASRASILRMITEKWADSVLSQYQVQASKRA